MQSYVSSAATLVVTTFLLTAMWHASTAQAAKKRPADTGLATSLHEVKRKGRKLCLVSHTHDGSARHRRKKTALRQAKRDWSSFTVDEYGTRWGRYRNAVARKESCSKFNGLWTCYINARPCRR